MAQRTLLRRYSFRAYYGAGTAQRTVPTNFGVQVNSGMSNKFNPVLAGCFLLLLLLAAGSVNGQAQAIAAPRSDRLQTATNQSIIGPPRESEGFLRGSPLKPAPMLAPLYIGMAQGARDKARDAIGYYREALQLLPDSPAILNNLAWLLATGDDTQFRNGAEAVHLAQRACELTQYQEPMFVGTLAAAYSENGQFAEARKTAEAAISLAEAAGQPELAARNRQLIKWYEAGLPWHEPSPHREENLVFGLFLLLPVISGGWLVLFARGIRRRKLTAGWPGLILGNLLVLVFLLSFLPPAGEIYYRFIHDTTDAIDFTKISNRWFQRYWHLNPSGCRDDVDYSLQLLPGKRRITFVGDSFAAGHGIKDVADRFSNRLRRAHPDWEIHLLAQLGYDTGDELKYLQQCLDQGYQLDQVVLVYCLNDVSDLYPEWGRLLRRVAADAGQGGWLRRNSYLVNTLYYRIQAARNPDLKNYYHFVLDGYRGPVWEQQQQRLKAFRYLVQSHGGRLLVVTFPFVVALGPDYEYQPAHDALDRLWPELQVPHLDLLPVYHGLSAKQLTVNRYDAHPNEFADQLAAQALDKFLAGQLGPNPQRR